MFTRTIINVIHVDKDKIHVKISLKDNFKLNEISLGCRLDDWRTKIVKSFSKVKAFTNLSVKNVIC